MKTMKKLASVALALILTLALAAPAMAAEVTVKLPAASENTDPTTSETYKAYKIFDADVAGELPNQPITDPNGTGSTFDHVAYSIKSNSPFYTTVSAFSGISLTQITVEGEGDAAVTTYNVAVTDDFNAANLAAALQTLVNSENIPADETGNQAATLEQDATLNLGEGYWLIVGTLGSKAILDTVGQENVTITTKNALPTIKKTTPPAEGLKIGDSVDYTVTVHAQPGATKYVVHDTMGTGLTFNGTVTVTVGAETLTEGTDYTLKVPTEETPLADGCSFEVEFAQTYLNGITAATDIVLTYSATINENATVNVDTTTNKAQLDYGENGHTEETDDTKAETPLYQFDLSKTNSKNEMLAGAEFELQDADGNKIDLVLDDGSYRPAMNGETPVEKIVTNDSTAINFKGFGVGTYQLVETKAPDGYNNVREPVKFAIAQAKDSVTGEPKVDADGKPVMTLVMITADGNTEVGFNADITPATEAAEGTPATPATWNEGGIQVVNLTGLELPETGGIGTTIFYVVGGLLVVGAGVLLVTKKRMSGEEE